jgi:transposase
MQIQRLQKRLYHTKSIDEIEYSKIAYERMNKLDRMTLLLNEGCFEEVALQAINLSRATYYRWKKRYSSFGLAGLENANKRPNYIRKPQWSKETEQRIYLLRKKYPLWGKQKIAVMYQREYTEKISQSTVGRILSKFMRHGKIKRCTFFLFGKQDVKKRVFDGHAQRWKQGMKAKVAGELIQVDHMTVHIPGLGYVKHFTATCPTTKYATYQVYREATSKNAADFFNHIEQTFPFPILSIQVDGGSEFMGHFENICKHAQIPLLVLPPRSPELNGNVERNNGVAKYEFYAQYTAAPKLEVIKEKLQEFRLFYNNIRPHQGIKLLTPSQFYEEIKIRSESHMY